MSSTGKNLYTLSDGRVNQRMAWLLFMDESGHSHKELPYEVRGGFALADKQLWPFVQETLQLELSCFGARLAEYKSEVKGTILCGF